MAAELEPWAGGGDVVSGALALDLDQDLGVVELLAVPGVEGLKELEAVGLWVNDNGVGRAVGWWVSVVVLALEPALKNRIKKCFLQRIKPRSEFCTLDGSSSPFGGSNLNFSPFGAVSSSRSGSKFKSPVMA